MGGFSNVGTDDVVYCDNVDFSGNEPQTKGVTANGQLLIGSAVAPNIRVGTLTAGTGISIANAAGSITISSTVTSGIQTINGDSGSITGSTVTIYANNAAVINAGATVKFVNSGTTSTLSLSDDTNANTLLGARCGNLTMSGIANTGIGRSCLPSLTSGIQNTGIGNGTLAGVTSGGGNAAVGYLSGQGITTGIYNCAFGSNVLSSSADKNHNNGFGALALQSCTAANNNGFGFQALNRVSGNDNIGIGEGAGYLVTSGANNILIGSLAGSAYTSSESGNINIGNIGVVSESNVTRIGTNQTLCYIQGISGVTVTGTAVLCATDGKLGTVVSSKRYKDNIVDMPKDVSVMNLRPVQFNYKKHKEVSYGLVAEEVHENFPYLCFYKDEQPESVKYHELCVFLLAEIQRLEKRVVALGG